MYSVYVGESLLYSPDLANDGYIILSPRMTSAVNKAGSFSFLLPPKNPLYDSIQKLTSIITVWDGNEEIFRGRVLHDEKDFYNRKKVYCEGELSFLLDSVVRPYDFSGDIPVLFNQFIEQHNSQVEAEKRFTVGTVNVTDPNNYIVRASAMYPKTWDELNDKFLNLLGGYIRTRKSGTTRYIDYVTDYGHVNNQVIEFGINMLDISEYISADELFTGLIPLGKLGDDEKRLTIASVNDGKDYLVDEDAVRLFGYVWKTHEWDDVGEASNLIRKGREYLNAGIELAVSLTLNAVDLHLLNVDNERISVGDMVRVVSIPHKIDRYFLCSKIILDLMNPNLSEYTFGFTATTMTERNLTSANNLQNITSAASNAIQVAQGAAESVQQAVSDIDRVIVDIPTEYVKTEVFNSFKNEVNGKIAAVYHVRGSVDNFDSLPIINEIGDVYNLLDTGANYAWTSNGWDKLSETVDLSGMVEKAQFESLISRVAALEAIVNGTDPDPEPDPENPDDDPESEPGEENEGE